MNWLRRSLKIDYLRGKRTMSRRFRTVKNNGCSYKERVFSADELLVEIIDMEARK
jgi:hypothetical protein